jgi:hypothetical protein
MKITMIIIPLLSSIHAAPLKLRDLDLGMKYPVIELALGVGIIAASLGIALNKPKKVKGNAVKKVVLGAPFTSKSLGTTNGRGQGNIRLIK